MDEQALIHDAQEGNLDAFNTLILHYQDSVYNTALRILGDDDLAADATQEAFIYALLPSSRRKEVGKSSEKPCKHSRILNLARARRLLIVPRGTRMAMATSL